MSGIEHGKSARKDTILIAVVVSARGVGPPPVRLRCLVGSSRARLAATMVPRLETHQLVNGI